MAKVVTVPHRFVGFDEAAGRVGGEAALRRILYDDQLTAWFREVPAGMARPLAADSWSDLEPSIERKAGLWHLHNADLLPGEVLIEAATLDALLAMSEAKEGGHSGRPPKYAWDDFWSELVVRADLDGLPPTMAEAEREMSDWCQEAWGEPPSESTIRAKLAKVYRHPRKAGK